MDVMRENTTAFADVDSSQLSCPFVDVAEEVTMDALEMDQIEDAFKRLRASS